MAFEALRFIHAAGVLADHQVRDTAPCDAEVRSKLIEATLLSFERIIEACVDHEVDFLLLTGDTFDESDRSLQARVAIRDGFQCLEEAGIDVFVVPGPRDSQDAWASFKGLPDNVSLFVPEVDEPTAIMRHGNVLATLQACLGRSAGKALHHEESSSIGQSRIGPFRIGIVPPFVSGRDVPDKSVVDTWLSTHRVDYLAVPLPFARLSVTRMEQVAHGPGPATSMSRDDLGPAGCSLVTITARSSISTEMIVTSPVRREKIKISIGETATWDQLMSAMRGYVESLPALDRASVLMLNWELTGSGSLHESLQDADAEQELFELLEADSSLADGLHMIHSLSLLDEPSTDAAELPQGSRETLSDDDSEEGGDSNPLLTGFLRRIDKEQSIAGSVIRHLSSQSVEPSDPWVSRLETLAGRISHKAVATRSRSYGTEWFDAAATNSTDDSGET
jgi:DNA repair protein SbcD/Mre11